MERTPSGPKRFELSREPFAKERVRGIQDAVEEIRKERPEIVSLALFGSLVKGTSREESDLDVAMYIDADSLQKSHSHSEEELLLDRKWDLNIERNGTHQDVTVRWKELRKDVASEYEAFVREKIKARLPTLTTTQLKDIRANPISKQIIDDMLDDIKASYVKYPDGVESTRIYFNHLIKEGEEARAETKDSRVEPSHLLWQMFFLDAGGGLREYRKHLLARLISMGTIGEKIWTDIIGSTESWEQKIPSYQTTPTNKRYPRTLEEAVALYGR